MKLTQGLVALAGPGDNHATWTEVGNCGPVQLERW